MNIEFAKAGDCAELLDFLHSVFLRDKPDHIRFEKLFPDIFLPTDEAMRDHAVVRESGRIVSCVGAYPMTLRVAGCDVPIAGIGQVSTAKDWLGKGCMSALLKAQLERLRAEGVALVWLGGRHDRYAHFGFETGSLAFHYGLDDRSLRTLGRTRAVARHQGPDARAAALTPALYALRETTSPATVLEPRERFLARLARADCEIWTATPAGAAVPDAWAVVSKEWRALDLAAGSVEGVLEIAAEASKTLGTFLTVVVPPAPSLRPLAEALRARCAWMGPRSESLCVLDRDKLLEAYAPCIRPGTRLPSKDLDSAALVRACFGPEPDAPLALPFALPSVYHV